MVVPFPDHPLPNIPFHSIHMWNLQEPGIEDKFVHDIKNYIKNYNHVPMQRWTWNYIK